MYWFGRTYVLSLHWGMLPDFPVQIGLYFLVCHVFFKPSYLYLRTIFESNCRATYQHRNS